ncbi:MAG: beta-galactosidase [Mariniphaga sp.]|nr:beta-galactosidase [Mariniphaga sp.]
MNNEKLSYYGILGVCYYPEVWPEKMWRDDLKLMYDTGIRLIRIAEFAWGIIEPREGEYHFELFDKIISICEEIGIKVLMCTPTAAVPAWIPQKYPEVMKWNIQRQPLKYGSRKDLCYSSRAFLKLCDNVVKQLGKHYAKSPSVIGWQIDNEINCGSHTSYSPEDRRHFIVFLKEKYKTLDALNAAWGTNFWSQQYSEWEQVDLPGETAEAGNPSQLLDEKYFINWQVNYFASRQVKILKSINSEWIITHNGAFPNVNLEQFRKHFDVFGYDQYPSFYHCWQDATINLSKIRGHSNRFWILEQVSGPGGKLNFLHPTPEPGQI